MANVGLIAAVIHDVLTAEKFDAVADLSEAVKRRGATLKIPYDAGTVTEAIQLVERTRPVVALGIKPITRIKPLERLDDDVQPITRAEAAELWPRLVAAVQRTQRTA